MNTILLSFVLLLFMCLSPPSLTSEDCVLRQDCHLHHFDGIKSDSTSSIDPELKKLSSTFDVEQLHLKTRKGKWTTREEELPKHIVTAWNHSTEAWCANCTQYERNLDKYFRYQHGAQDLDITQFPIVDKLRLLANQHVLFLGDSLMRQVFYSLFWIFPGSSRGLQSQKA